MIKEGVVGTTVAVRLLQESPAHPDRAVAVVNEILAEKEREQLEDSDDAELSDDDPSTNSGKASDKSNSKKKKKPIRKVTTTDLDNRENKKRTQGLVKLLRSAIEINKPVTLDDAESPVVSLDIPLDIWKQIEPLLAKKKRQQ